MDAAMDLQRLLSHNHWFTLEIGTYRIHLCSRCSGTVIGYFLFIFALRSLDMTSFHSLSSLQQFSASFLMGLPSGVDWLTQTWKLRESTNKRRLIHGFLVGAGAALLSMSSLPNLSKTLSLASSASVVVGAGYLGRWLRTMRNASL